MQFLWAMSILFTMMTMGIIVIIIGQQSHMAFLDKPYGKEPSELQKRYSNMEFFRTTLENMVFEKTKEFEDMEIAMAQLYQVMEQKKKERDTCQTDENTKSEELALKEKEQTEIEANFKIQSGVWSNEIALLTEQLTGHREICNYMVTDPQAKKLCDPKPV